MAYTENPASRQDLCASRKLPLSAGKRGFIVLLGWRVTALFCHSFEPSSSLSNICMRVADSSDTLPRKNYSKLNAMEKK
jgi:hypothetical protein